MRVDSRSTPPVPTPPVPTPPAPDVALRARRAAVLSRMSARLPAAGLILVAWVLRVYRLGDADIWWDEGLAVWAVRQGSRAATAWTAGDVHPPLFFWQLWAWRLVAGETAFALRLVVAMTGLLAVAVTGVIAWRLGGRRAGLLALAIAGVARFAVWWSGELRMYMLAALGVVVALYALVRWLGDDGRARSAARERGVGRGRDGRGGRAVNGDRHVHADRDANGDRDTNVDRDANGDRDAHRNHDAHRDRDAHRDDASAPRPIRWLVVYVVAASAVLHTVYLAGVALGLMNLPVLAAIVAPVIWSRRARTRAASASGRVERLDREAARSSSRQFPRFAATPRSLSRADAVRWALAQLAAVASFVPWAMYAAGRTPSWRIVDEGPGFSFVWGLWTMLLATGKSTDIGASTTVAFAFTIVLIAVIALIFVAVAPEGETGDVEGHSDLGGDVDVEVDRTRDRTGERTTVTSRASAEEDRQLPTAVSDGWDDRRSRPAPGMASVGVAILVAIAIGAPLVAWAITQPRDLFYSPRLEARYFVPFTLPVYAGLAWLLAAAGRWRGVALAVPLLAIMGGQLRPYYAAKQETTELAAMAVAIWSQAEENDAVLLVSGDRYPLFLYAYEREWATWRGIPDEPYVFERAESGRDEFRREESPDEETRRAEPEGARSSMPPSDRDWRPPFVPLPGRGGGSLAEHPDWREQLEALAANHDRLWLASVESHHQDPGGEVEAWLEEHMPRVWSEGYGPDALHLFARDGRAPVVTSVSERWPHMTRDLHGEGVELAHPIALRPPARGAAGMGIETAFFLRPTEAEIVGEASLVDTEYGRVAGSEAVRVLGDGGRMIRRRITLNERTPGGLLDLRAAAWEEDGGRVIRLHRPFLVDRAQPIITAQRDPRVAWPSASLSTVAVWPYELERGGTLTVDLGWSPTGPLEPQDERATVFVHLVESSSIPAATRVGATGDGPPSSGTWGFDRHIVQIPPDMKPGYYVLQVGLYDRETGERETPTTRSSGNQCTPDCVSLGLLEVR